MEKIELWKDPEKRMVDPLLFSQGAEKLAQIVDAQKKRNKPSQLRKFYDEVVRIEALTKNRSKENDWLSILPMLHMLTAKAAYAEGRKLISSDFRLFIRDCVGQIQRPEDLAVFSSFFEAFMGFYKLYRPSN